MYTLAHVGACLLHLICLYFETSSLIVSAWLAGQQTTGTHLSLALRAGVIDIHAHSLFLSEWWGSELRSCVYGMSTLLTETSPQLLLSHLTDESLTSNQPSIHIFLTFEMSSCLCWGIGHSLYFTACRRHDVSRCRNSVSRAAVAMQGVSGLCGGAEWRGWNRMWWLNPSRMEASTAQWWGWVNVPDVNREP